MSRPVVDYRRNLPHWFPEGRAIFVTWRLYGSLPAAFWARLREEKRYSAREEFRCADASLDSATTGPLWLNDSRIAEHVVATLHRGEELRHYDLHAYVVMANHVHALITPRIEFRQITNAIKGVTAREANKILNRRGNRFWQEESFDHWLRNEQQFERSRNYIEKNPVKAGLVASPEEWRWSSAYADAKQIT